MEQSKVESRQESELSPSVQGTWTRRVSLHGTISFNGTIYRVPEEMVAELAGQSIYVFKSPESGRVRGERVNYDIVPVDDAVFELREMASCEAKAEPENNGQHTNYIKEAVNGNGHHSDINDQLDDLGTEDLRLIALYEMYADLEVNFRRPFTEKFTQSLNESQSKLIDHYLASKIAVLDSNQTLSIQPKKKAGAEA